MDNLPRYFVLESLSNNKYLRYVHEEVALHGHLEFSGEEAISPYTKYELEPAKNQANSGLFSIRCCYNNKYWARKEESTAWITATADEPEENPFKWTCTLFEASLQGSNNSKPTLRMRHVQHRRNAVVSIGGSGGDPKYLSCLNADANAPVLPGDPNIMFSIIDFESFVILPKIVLFKGDNGLYISNNTTILLINSDEVASASFQHEVFYTRDGSVRIKNSASSKFWKATRELVSASQIVNDDDPYTTFSPFKPRGEDEVALLNKGTGKYCQRRSEDTKFHSIGATSDEIVKEAILKVEEPVALRSIYNVDFRLRDARTYNQSDVLLVSKRLSNQLDVDKVTNVTEKFTNETTRTWKSNVSLKLATPTTIETEIPLIVDGEVGIWDAFKGSYEWGTDVKGSQSMEVSEDVTIPAKSAVMVHVIATRALCDVPFSYTQRDRLFGGKVTINKMDDGVYTGVNYYNIKTQVVKIC